MTEKKKDDPYPKYKGGSRLDWHKAITAWEKRNPKQAKKKREQQEDRRKLEELIEKSVDIPDVVDEEIVPGLIRSSSGVMYLEVASGGKINKKYSYRRGGMTTLRKPKRGK